MSGKNEEVRLKLVEFLRESFEDRPDILSQIVPNYPPYAKRSVRDDGTWAAALKKDNVTLTSSGILSIEEHGIRTQDDVLHGCDVIIYGTGFRASEFLSTIDIRGRNSVDLQEQWAGDARAYWGITIPNFPNFFCLYGPNTNLNVNGSTVLFSEAAVEYTLECIKLLPTTGHRALDIGWEAFDEYNEWIDASNKLVAAGVSTVNSWYRNALGRLSQNWPLTTLEYWNGTRTPKVADYELL